jgi:rhodanese-related sulfurtransferase
MLERLFRRFRAPIGPAWVEVDDLRRRLRRGELALVLDVREPDEFDGPLGHIPGALNVPLASLPARIADFTRVGCPIVTVCLTDKRSSQAAAELVESGVPDVAVLRGGMRAWRANEPATLGEGATSGGAP